MHDLDRAFNPKTVAVIGDKQALGYMWLRALKAFQGKVYSVQIDPNELPGIEAFGVPNYRSLLDIPDEIDYAIVSVPRGVAPRIVDDLVQKRVGGAAFFTSGFAETATEEGIRLQEQLTARARAAGLKLIGPNCVGIFNPTVGLRHNPDQYVGNGGNVGFIAQSGTHASHFSLVGFQEGILVSKSVSYGNAVILDSSDYLEYLGQDPQTQIIGMYIEGVKDGRRFFQQLREVARRKPVLVWKGGETEVGARATASHTASLAASGLVWDAMVKQCGAIKVSNLEETLDTTKLLLHARPPSGPRVGLVAMSGGQSVVIADAFGRAGLEVPLFTEASYQKLASFFSLIGGSYRNPLDIATNFVMVADAFENFRRMLDIVNEDDNVDCLVVELSPSFIPRRWTEEFLKGVLGLLTALKERSDKTLLAVITPAHRPEAAERIKTELREHGIPSYPTFERAARALKKVVDYYQARRESGGEERA